MNGDITRKCARHPEVEASRYCQKTDRWFCRECGAACETPKIYCKFRTACMIWALEHDKGGHLSGGPGGATWL